MCQHVYRCLCPAISSQTTTIYIYWSHYTDPSVGRAYHLVFYDNTNEYLIIIHNNTNEYCNLACNAVFVARNHSEIWQISGRVFLTKSDSFRWRSILKFQWYILTMLAPIARIVPNNVDGAGCIYPEMCMVGGLRCGGIKWCSYGGVGFSSRSVGLNHSVPPSIWALLAPHSTQKILNYQKWTRIFSKTRCI